MEEAGFTLRLAELPVEGSPEDCVGRACEAAAIEPLPDLTVFPELYTTGYVLDRIPDLALDPADLQGMLPAEVARETGQWLFAGTLPVRLDAGVVNTMVVYAPDGSLAYTTGKVHLFRQMGEERAFVPGSCGGVFDMGGTTSAGMVCFDLRFPELARRLVLAGARLLVVPAEWPSGRTTLFRSLLRARAAESQVFVAGCNLGGDHLGVRFRGGGGLAHPSGRMVKGSEVAEGVTDYPMDPYDVDLMRQKIDCLADMRPSEYVCLEGGAG